MDDRFDLQKTHLNNRDVVVAWLMATGIVFVLGAASVL